MKIDSQLPPEDSSGWHPKITPYRSLVFFFTVGFGFAKTIAVYNNLSLTSIHIEWVTGVIIFPIMFFLGLYECETECTPPASLKLLMSSDLVPIFSRMLSQSPPQHRTDEVQQFFLADHNNQRPLLFPPVTGYRLLTTVLVCLFGIPKAYLVSRDKLFVASVLEWGFGTVVTLLLYILGLYERNPVNLMPFLFSTDYSIIFVLALWFTVFAVGISPFPATVWFSFPLILSRWSTEFSKESDLFANGNNLLSLGLFIVGVALLLAAALFTSFYFLKFCWVMSPASVTRIERYAIFKFHDSVPIVLGCFIASVFCVGCGCIFFSLWFLFLEPVSSWKSAPNLLLHIVESVLLLILISIYITFAALGFVGSVFGIFTFLLLYFLIEVKKKVVH